MRLIDVSTALWHPCHRGICASCTSRSRNEELRESIELHGIVPQKSFKAAYSNCQRYLP